MNRKKMIRDYCIIHFACGIAFLVTIAYMFLQYKGLISKMPCLFFEFTHVYCPGCGGTRALFALLRGRVVQSLRMNPAILLGICLILYYEAGAWLTIIKANGKCYYNKKGIPLYLYLAVIMIFAVIRDIMLAGYGIDWLN